MGRDAQKVQAPESMPTLESSPDTEAVQCCASSGKASWAVGQGIARSKKGMLDLISDPWAQHGGDMTLSLPTRG